MTDWKQITARIRRARLSKDPLAQLSSLFEKTRDAMVAFELARYLETSGQNPDAAKWYATAAERFRRADWKTKAQEAAVRLGAEVAAVTSPEQAEEFLLARPPAPPPAAEAPLEETTSAASEDDGSAVKALSTASAQPPPEPGDRKRRHRGRRGGRNRRRGGAQPQATSRPAPATGVAPPHSQPLPSDSQESDARPPKATHGRAIPPVPPESFAEAGEPSPRGRFGDPGLSSRLSLLEMQLRRLLNCTPSKLSDADHAPAGPGVFVLTDSDLTSYYYVEACQTLRIAIGSLLRGGARRGAESIKPRLAEHLGIPESRVAKYLADHCVVRWLQLDEGASFFAHFVIAVIRPSLND